MYGTDVFLGRDNMVEPLPLASVVRTALDSSNVTISVAGTSMHPTFSAGDRVVVERCHASDLRPGEIALIGDRGLCVHRFMGSVRALLLFKGDNSRSFDPLRESSAVLGRVVARIRGGCHDRPHRRPVRVWFSRWRYRLVSR